MWPRVVTVMLGSWLLLSPFVFSHPPSRESWWLNDLLCGALIVSFELAACWPPFRPASMGTAAVAVWLLGYGYFAADHPRPAAAENRILFALIVLMFVIIPSLASKPPAAWRGDAASE